MTTITMAADLAKQAFSTCGVDVLDSASALKIAAGPFAAWVAQVPAGTVNAMEA